MQTWSLLNKDVHKRILPNFNEFKKVTFSWIFTNFITVGHEFSTYDVNQESLLQSTRKNDIVADIVNANRLDIAWVDVFALSWSRLVLTVDLFTRKDSLSMTGW